MYAKVLGCLQNYSTNSLTLVEEGEYSCVKYSTPRGEFHFLLQTPEVLELGDMKADILITPSSRTVGDDVRRFCHKTLISDLPEKVLNAPTLDDIIRPTMWDVISWWDNFLEVLVEADRSLQERPSIEVGQVSRYFGNCVTNLIMRCEVVKSDIHLKTHANALRMGFPGRNPARGIMNSALFPSEQHLQFIKEAFWKKADEMGYDLLSSPKGHTGRILMAKSTSEFIQKSLGVWANFGYSRRSKRELWSAIPNAVPFVNPRPVIVGKQPEFMEDYITSVNAMIGTIRDIVPDGINVDQLVITGWDNVFASRHMNHVRVPYELGQSKEDVLFKFPEGSEIELIQRPLGPGYEMFWIVSYPMEKDKGVFKLTTPDGIKGMVQRIPTKFVEKRADGKLYPIHLIISNETIKSKDAQRLVLRAMTSHIPGYVPNQDIPREQYPNVYRDIRKKRANKLKTQIFILDTGFEATKTQVAEFTIEGIGKVSGALRPVQVDNKPFEAITGEVIVIRLPEDEDHGRAIHDVRIDPFMVLGKGFEITPSEDVKREVNFIEEVYSWLDGFGHDETYV